MTILRTQRDGCWSVQSNAWGQFLAPAVDPDADTVITQEQLKGFELHPDIPRIPAKLWARWMSLTRELVRRGTGDLEVSCRLLRKLDDPSQYRIYVPVQKVTGVSVRVDSFDNAIDIETGEVATQWPPEGWRPCGSSHSHNTMDAFFSGTDDKYELGDPGLHIVVGQIDLELGTYKLVASITANMRRFLIDPSLVVDNDPDLDAPYAPNCLDVIAKPTQSVPRTISIYNPVSDGYDPEPFIKPIDPSLAESLQTVRAAVDLLVARSRKLNINPRDALSDLAMEIDEIAYAGSRVEDPFYWNDDLY